MQSERRLSRSDGLLPRGGRNNASERTNERRMGEGGGELECFLCHPPPPPPPPPPRRRAAFPFRCKVHRMIVCVKPDLFVSSSSRSLGSSRTGREFLSDVPSKMCLKSPGTDVGASGFERCPRTFETHFILPIIVGPDRPLLLAIGRYLP